MRFVHEDPDFPALLDTVAAEGPLASAAMVEKDYWICHALWALRRSGIEFWFKGGTSLSKAFDIVQRFSEDLDLIVLPGRLELPKATSWKTETAGAIRSREAFWRALLDRIEIPGARLEWDNEHDPSQRNAGFRVVYPGHLVEQFRGAGSVIKPFVLLEISHGSVARSARAPSVERSISSTVHDWLVREGRMDAFLDNRPVAVESVHPYVTLLEKLDAITRRYGRADEAFDASTIARHYEDAARIIRNEATLPSIEGGILELAREMLHRGQLRRMITRREEAFALTNGTRRVQIERSYEALRPMYWGVRMSLEEAAATIVGWLQRNDS